MHQPNDRAAILLFPDSALTQMSPAQALSEDFAPSLLELADRIRQTVYKDFASALYGQILTLRAGQIWQISSPYQFPQSPENLLRALFSIFSTEFSMIERDSEGFLNLELPPPQIWGQISRQRELAPRITHDSRVGRSTRDSRSLFSLTIEQIAARYAKAVTIPARPLNITQIYDYQRRTTQYHFPVSELHPQLVSHFEDFSTFLTGAAPGIRNLSCDLPLKSPAADHLKSETLTTFHWPLYQNLPTDFNQRQQLNTFQSLVDQAQFLHRSLYVSMTRSALCTATYLLIVQLYTSAVESGRLIGNPIALSNSSRKALYQEIDSQYQKIQAGEILPSQIDFDAAVSVEDYEGLFTPNWTPPPSVLAARRAVPVRPQSSLHPYGISPEELNYWMVNLLDQQAAQVRTSLEALSNRSTWERLSTMTLLEAVLYLRPKGILDVVQEIPQKP